MPRALAKECWKLPSVGASSVASPVPFLRVYFYLMGSVQSSSVWQAQVAYSVNSLESVVHATLIFVPLSLTSLKTKWSQLVAPLELTPNTARSLAVRIGQSESTSVLSAASCPSCSWIVSAL